MTAVQGSKLFVRGLPWKTSKSELSLFLLSKGLDAREDSIHMLCTRCKSNGRAIVYCADNYSAMKAAEATHLAKFGSRYIEVYVHTEVDKIFGAFVANVL